MKIGAKLTAALAAAFILSVGFVACSDDGGSGNGGGSNGGTVSNGTAGGNGSGTADSDSVTLAVASLSGTYEAVDYETTETLGYIDFSTKKIKKTLDADDGFSFTYNSSTGLIIVNGADEDGGDVQAYIKKQSDGTVFLLLDSPAFTRTSGTGLIGATFLLSYDDEMLSFTFSADGSGVGNYNGDTETVAWKNNNGIITITAENGETISLGYDGTKLYYLSCILTKYNGSSGTVTAGTGTGTTGTLADPSFSNKAYNAKYATETFEETVDGVDISYFMTFYLFRDNTCYMEITYTLVSSDSESPITEAEPVEKGTYTLDSGNYSDGTITITVTDEYDDEEEIWLSVDSSESESYTLTVQNGIIYEEEEDFTITFIRQ